MFVTGMDIAHVWLGQCDVPAASQLISFRVKIALFIAAAISVNVRYLPETLRSSWACCTRIDNRLYCRWI